MIALENDRINKEKPENKYKPVYTQVESQPKGTVWRIP